MNFKEHAVFRHPQAADSGLAKKTRYMDLEQIYSECLMLSVVAPVGGFKDLLVDFMNMYYSGELTA